jgi:hypothetical protein
MDDIKNFLYSFLGKQHKTPNYEVSQIMGKNRQLRFKCDVSLTLICSKLNYPFYTKICSFFN